MEFRTWDFALGTCFLGSFDFGSGGSRSGMEGFDQDCNCTSTGSAFELRTSYLGVQTFLLHTLRRN